MRLIVVPLAQQVVLAALSYLDHEAEKDPRFRIEATHSHLNFRTRAPVRTGEHPPLFGHGEHVVAARHFTHHLKRRIFDARRSAHFPLFQQP